MLFAGSAGFIGSNIVMELFTKFPKSRLLGLSSVYGTNKKIPYLTDNKVDNSVTLYAATKKSNELLAHVYFKLYFYHILFMVLQVSRYGIFRIYQQIT